MTDTDRELLELARLRELLRYEPATGLFRWRVTNSNRAKAGALTGARINSDGYKHVTVDGRIYRAHRLAWFYVHGKWPDQIDHLNGDRADNRLANLREVDTKTNTHNQLSAHRNNRSGLMGVVRRGDKYQAQIRVNGKKVNIGTFSSPGAAHAAYLEAKRIHHPGAKI